MKIRLINMLRHHHMAQHGVPSAFIESHAAVFCTRQKSWRYPVKYALAMTAEDLVGPSWRDEIHGVNGEQWASAHFHQERVRLLLEECERDGLLEDVKE